MSDHALKRITRELHAIQQTNDLSIRVEYQDSDLLSPKALILGPPGTPYEFGFFEFSVKFPKDYPDKAPVVNCLTTNAGRTRFNPNIYGNGKVCLSILGTWRGDPGEQWSSAQGLESILISIQSLLSANPYENEPGFENRSSKADEQHKADYVAKIKHETIHLAVIRPMEYYLGICSDGTLSADIKSPSTNNALSDRPDGRHQRPIIWEPFKDFYKRRFLWYFESYLNTINEQVRRHTAGTKFKAMPFEGTGNIMSGVYQYVELRRRLLLIRKMLDQETLRWAEEGRLAIKQERPLGAQTMLLYNKTREIFMDSHALNVDIGLEDKQNPFVWIITYFGRPLTNLDGGMFRIRLTIGPNFPDEWPRVVFETDLFHQRITREGVLCYVPRQYGELKNHVEAIVSTIEDEQPPYDPRVLVNLEASKLFWGSAEEKKEYNRRLRRSVQRSVED